MPYYRYHVGPWIEDVFIKYFSNKSIFRYGPFVPLLFNWDRSKYIKNNSKRAFRSLRNNQIAITASQHDNGIEKSKRYPPQFYVHPNLIVVSVSGQGHILVPDLKQHIQPAPFLKKKGTISFFGKIREDKPATSREHIVNYFHEKFGQQFYTKFTRNWLEMIPFYDLCLSPRGETRNTFRTFECLQLGIIPLILNDAYFSVPYYNSTVKWDLISIIGSTTEMGRIDPMISVLDSSEVIPCTLR